LLFEGAIASKNFREQKIGTFKIINLGAGVRQKGGQKKPDFWPQHQVIH